MSISQFIFDGYLSKKTSSASIYDSYEVNILQPVGNVSHVRFTDLVIPYTWYNIDERWKLFSIEEQGIGIKVITLDAKHYEVSDFLSVLQTKLNASSTNTYSVVLDLQTGFLKISTTKVGATLFRINYDVESYFLNCMLGFW